MNRKKGHVKAELYKTQPRDVPELRSEVMDIRLKLTVSNAFGK